MHSAKPPVRSASPPREASVVSFHTPVRRIACAVCGRMVSDTAHAREQHVVSVFHIQASLRAQHPGTPEPQLRAEAERRAAAAWQAYAEQGAAAAASSRGTRRGTARRGKKPGQAEETRDRTPPPRVSLHSRKSVSNRRPSLEEKKTVSKRGPSPSPDPVRPLGGGKGPEPPPPDGAGNQNMQLLQSMFNMVLQQMQRT